MRKVTAACLLLLALCLGARAEAEKIGVARSLDAACAAAWLHGAAGDSAANRYGEYGMTPTDLLACLPGVTRRYNTREW